MKKILTLLVMFLATASILTAQTPKLNYQMIVRDKSNNNLVVNKSVSGTVSVKTAGVTNPVYTKNFTETTNMNGMLSIILDNQSGSTNLEKIDWAHSQFRVVIGAYGIDTIMDIYPVLYAYNVFTDSNITTPRILKYIENSTVNDVIRIDSAITHNEGFINALRDSVANAMKRNPGMVKQLSIYFLGMTDVQDVNAAAQAIKSDVAKFVKDTVAAYIKNHRTEVYDILKYYIGQTTKDDVTGLWHAAMQSPEADNIVKMVVDSVNEYIKRNPELATKTASYIVKHLTADDVFALQNFIKNNNQRAYDTAKSILNSLIDTFMINNHYQQKQCGVTDLCVLMNEIRQFAEYGTVVCPTLGETQVNSDYGLSTTITNSQNVTISSDNCYYELSFPNSNYSPKEVMINATYNNNIISATIPQEYRNRKISVRPKMEGLECMDVVTFGPAKIIDCSNNCECPNIASFTHTSDAAGELVNYHGIVLKAELTNNYHNNTTQTCGFEYKEGNGNWTELGSSKVIDGLTVTDTIKMNFCGKTLLVRPYVKCDNQKYYGQYSDGVTVTLRQFDLFISPESPVTGETEFTVTNGIYVGTDEFGTHWPSVEQIVAKYGATYGVNVNPSYSWSGTGFTQSGATATISTTGDYTVTCTIPALFNSNENCVLEKTFHITVQ